MSSEQKDFVCEHLKIKSFNENYALATKFFQNRTQTKKKGKFFLFLIVYFVFFKMKFTGPKMEFIVKTRKK
jgi:hypothetical protein